MINEVTLLTATATKDDVTRSLPYAVMHEKSVLSTLLKEPLDCFPVAQEEGVTADYYYLPSHRELFKFMLARYEARECMDLLTIIQGLLDKGLLDRVGGPSAITDLYTYAPSAGHFREHLASLRDKYILRSVIRISTESVALAYDEPDNPTGLLDEVTNSVGELRDTLVGASTEVSMKQLTESFIIEFEKLMRKETTPMGISTGIPEIDQCIRGLHPCHLGIISARSSGGKSTLASQIFVSVGEEHKTAYFPFEGTIDAHFKRCVIQKAKVHHEAVIDPGNRQTSKHELQSIQQAIKELNNGNYRFEQVRSRQIGSLVAAIRRCHRLHGIEVAFVDYLQLLRAARGRNDSSEREYADISHSLQQLATDLKISIVLLSQESDEGNTKYAKAIEEDSDWWLSIVQYRDKTKDNYTQHRHILVAKDRYNGTAGTRLPLQLDKEQVRFKYGIEEKQEEKSSRWSK